MNLDITIHRGKGRRPPVSIFVHGLGMDKLIWTEPARARVLGGLAPLPLMFRKEIAPPFRTLFHDLRESGHTVIAWSQSRPAGPIREAVRELREVIDLLSSEGAPVVLIGHSRGGLIARSVFEGGDKKNLRALVTLASPHRGSTMAKWASHLGPLASFLDPLFPERRKGALSKAIRKTLGFFESEGVKELLPEADFIKSLGKERPGGVYCLSVGGTSPSLLRVNNLFSIPGVFAKILPGLPDEMAEGKGDGMISVESSRLPYGDEHLSFPYNHAEMFAAEEVREAVVQRLRGLDL